MKADPIILDAVNGKEFITLEEAATLLSLGYGTIQNYLGVGKFKNYKFKKLTLLKVSELKVWDKERHNAKSRTI